MNRLFILLAGLMITFGLYGCSRDMAEETHDHVGEKAEVYYTCSMHPQIKEKKPGKCPICHMNLTKIEVEADGVEANVIEEKVKEVTWYCENFPDVTSEVEEVCPIDGTPMVKKEDSSGAQEVVAKVKLRKSQLGHFFPEYFPATTMTMTKEIRLLGSVKQSEEKESNIPARIGGRVEKVYLKSTGSFVKVGDPVVDLYSPKLITAGEEYILARKSVRGSKANDFRELLKQSEERLKLWGIQDIQYNKWFEDKAVPRSITIYSNATGIVRKKNATVGEYFQEGQNFFELSDLSAVWIEMDVYESDSSLIEIGQKVEFTFSAIPGEKTVGEIDFVTPFLDAESRTLKVRATIKNLNGKLKPGMIADSTLMINYPGKPLVVPRSAIIDTGARKVVWVGITGRAFQAKTIMTGFESNGYVEVKSGLMEGEEVVIEGNFLLDAQAQLFGGYEDFNKGSEANL